MPTIGLDGDFQGLPLLTDWLRADGTLGRSRIRTISQRPNIESMGSLSDIIDVSVASGGILPALAASLATWATSRRRKFTLIVDGKSVEVTGSKRQDELVVEILDRLQSQEH